MIEFSFRLWLESGIWKRRPIQLQWGNEFEPPTDPTGQEDYSGPGLICFDFDKTLTAGIQDPQDPSGRASRWDQPNSDTLDIAHRHKTMGHHVLIVTGRGETSNREAGMIKRPSIDVYQAIKQWGLGGLFDNVVLTGGDSVSTPAADKNIVIARLMVKYGAKWGLLYDDSVHNCQLADSMQAKGFALRGIPVRPKIVRAAG